MTFSPIPSAYDRPSQFALLALGGVALLAVIGCTLILPAAETPGWILPRMLLGAVIAACFLSVQIPLRGLRIMLGFPAALLVYWIAAPLGQVIVALLIGVLLAEGARWLRHAVRARKGVANTESALAVIIAQTAQLALTVCVLDVVRRLLNGAQPLRAVRIADLPVVILMIALALITYLAAHWWLIRSRQNNAERLFAQNIGGLLFGLIIPLPLIIGAVLAFNTAQSVLFLILLGGAFLQAVWSAQLGSVDARFREQSVELQTVTSVSRAAQTDLKIDALMSAVYVQVVTAIDVTDIIIALYDDYADEVRFPVVVQKSLRIERRPQALGNDLIGRVIQQRTIARESDESGNYWVGVPLASSDRARGGIVIGRPQPFTEQDMTLLQSIAGQTAIAAENAALYADSERSARQLRMLNQLNARTATSLDLRMVAEQTLSGALELTGAQAGALFFYMDAGLSRLGMARASGRFQSGETAPAPTLKSDATEAAAFSLQEQGGKLNPDWIRAWVEIPMRDGDRALGFLVMYYSKPITPRPDDLALYQTYATQAALVTSNAQLYARTQDALARSKAQLDSLGDMNRELAAIYNLNALFDIILKRAMASTRAHAGLIVFTDENNIPRVVAHRLDADSSQAERAAFMQFDRVTRVQTHVIDHAPPDRPFTDLTQNSLTRLAVPVVKDYDAVGMIMLESRIADGFAPDDVQFVRQLAAQAAIAIYNVQMIGWMQDGSDRLKAILEAMHDAVIVITPEGRISLANDRCESLLGLRSHMILTETVPRLLDQPNILFAEKIGFAPQTLLNLFTKSGNETTLDVARYAYMLPNEGADRSAARFIERIVVPVYSSGQAGGLLMVFSDATERRQLEQTREDLSRMVVHDLRGPLTAISTSIKLLEELNRRNALNTASLDTMTDISQRAIRKMLTLVNSLLDISKMESGTLTLEREPVALLPIIDAVCKEMSPLADELAISLTDEIPANLPAVRIDSEKVERVLINLVDNALKYTPTEGTVSIRAVVHDADRIRVEVRDSGPGISDADKLRVFDRYQQVESQKSHRRGTGLGLTFCRMAIEAHGGTIWVEDNQPHGSVFAFTIPTAAHIG